MRRQHGVVSHLQLLASGFSRSAVRQRVKAGRLHRLLPGVYAVGRPTASREGWWMAAVLRCGEGAALSHSGAAQAWGILPSTEHAPEVSVPVRRNPREPRLRIHRRSVFPTAEVTRRFGIPITTPALTLVDLSPRLTSHRLERAVDQAVAADLITPDRLRPRLAALPRLPGVGILRRLLECDDFVLTEPNRVSAVPLLRRRGATCRKLPVPDRAERFLVAG